MELNLPLLQEAVNDAIGKLDPGHEQATISVFVENNTGTELAVIHLNTDYTSNWRLDNILNRISRNPKGHVTISVSVLSRKLELMLRKSNIQPQYFKK